MHKVDRHSTRFRGQAGLAVLLWATAGIGMAYVAGFDAVRDRLEHAHWWWLAPAFGSVVVALGGYLMAYRGINRAQRGPANRLPSMLALVTAGFGGLLARGATTLDEFAMRAGGADEREAKVRVAAMTGFEHGVLAIIVCPAAIVALVLGDVIPRPDFSWPWAVIPPLGFGVAIWLAERYRGRLRDGSGWRRWPGILLDAIHIVFQILRHPRRYGYAFLGMMLYWGADMFALWAATAAFGAQLTVLAIILALGTGMLLTRRSAPLGGAGFITVALVPTLWYGCAVPFAVAALGVAAYHFFTLFAPMPAALFSLPKLHALAEGS